MLTTMFNYCWTRFWRTQYSTIFVSPETPDAPRYLANWLDKQKQP